MDELKKAAIALVLGLAATGVTDAVVGALAGAFGIVGTLVAVSVTILVVTGATVLAAEKAADLLLDDVY